MNTAVLRVDARRHPVLHWCRQRAGCLALLCAVACHLHPSSPPLANQGARRPPCVKQKVLE